MRSLLQVFRLLAVSLWLGGIVALILFVPRLFETSRDVGIVAAPVLFRTFAVYQIIVGVIATISAIGSWAVDRNKSSAFAVILLIASLAAAFPIRSWTNQLEELRVSGQSQSDEFRALHHQSTVAYSASTIALLISAVLIALPAPLLPQTSKE